MESPMNLQDILLLENWLQTDNKVKQTAANEVARYLKQDFEVIQKTDSAHLNAVNSVEFRHVESMTEWCLIPGGHFQIGLSEKEERAARAIHNPPPINLDEMRPFHTKFVNPFLVMKYPVSKSFTKRHIVLQEKNARPIIGENDSYPIYLSQKEVFDLEENTGFTLPSESQWEYACRASTKSLFFWGDSLPNRDILDSYLGPDMVQGNPFGLHGLFWGEWCADLFTKTYDGPVVDKNSFVIRGGGSTFWPWQDTDEWAFCLSAMRMPSTDTFEGLSCARLVCDIDSV